MTVLEHVTQIYASNLDILKRTLADFSDADMLVRPVPGANHAAWQVGHGICSETRLVRAAGGTMPDLPEGFEAKFTRDTAKSDDPADFPTKAELLSLSERQRKGTIAWVASLKMSDLEKPTPERLRGMVPTVASVAALIPTHLTMHVGQIQVIRRKLGKPVLM